MLLVLESVSRKPEDVVLEITEREIVGDLGRLRSVVGSYRHEGFQFAVDDVGEGHSTLEVLAATLPDFVKIARSMVVEVGLPGPRGVIRAVVSFARETGALVVAEGIETVATARAMYKLDVDLAQGYLFGQPLLAEAIPQAVISLPPVRSAPPSRATADSSAARERTGYALAADQFAHTSTAGAS